MVAADLKIGNHIAPVATLEQEVIGTRTADENVVSATTIDKLTSGVPGDDVIKRIPDPVGAVARHAEIFDIARQHKKGIIADDRVHPGPGGFDDYVGLIVDVVCIVTYTAVQDGTAAITKYD